jgi:hypothetical protein
MTPNAKPFSRIRLTVTQLELNVSAICRSLHPSELFRKICARIIVRALLTPVLTVLSNVFRSLAFNFMVCLLGICAKLTSQN